MLRSGVKYGLHQSANMSFLHSLFKCCNCTAATLTGSLIQTQQSSTNQKISSKWWGLQHQSKSIFCHQPFHLSTTHTFKSTQAYSMHRLGLIGLAWSSTITQPTMELVSPNGPHRWDGLIVPAMEHFKPNRDAALWPAGKSAESGRGATRKKWDNMGEV